MEAHLSPGSSLSAFIAKHIEHPGSLHSKPASVKTLSKPSDSACCLTNPEPGTARASLMLGAIFFPFQTEAAARMSSILELVHEPMKILSTLTEFMGVLASRLMYFNAFE